MTNHIESTVSYLMHLLMQFPLAPCAACGSPASDLFAMCGHSTCGCHAHHACPTCLDIESMLTAHFRPNAYFHIGMMEKFEAEILSVKNGHADIRMMMFGTLQRRTVPMGYLKPL